MSIENENKSIAKVAVDLPLGLKNDDFFFYSIPEELKTDIKSGSIVKIPFGNQELNGYVLETSKEENLGFNLKSIYEIVFKDQIWDKKYIEFANWLSKYYMTNIGTVLSASIISDVLDEAKKEVEFDTSFSNIDSLSKEESFIVSKFLKSKSSSLSYKFLLQKSNLTKQKFYKIINNLKSKGVIWNKIQKKKQVKKESSYREVPIEKSNNINKIVLNSYQEDAFNKVKESLDKRNKNNLFLLHGVTGSGKTEVYIRLIEEAIKNGKNVIYLLPEIYLVPQIYQRLVERFDSKNIIIWHSSITKQDRVNNFERLINNDAKIILGARSASLVPMKNLGLIVIDEAHDASYKQASPAPRYDAIKACIKRGEIEDCPVLLGTATPNISEYYDCLKNGTLLELPHRVQDLPMPKVYITDLRREIGGGGRNIISTVLRTAINETLSRKEQVILLLNRRGYSSHIFCRACGYIQYCSNCSVPLTFHKNPATMVCHHCGYIKSINLNFAQDCPECKSPHFKFFGVGTEQLEEEVKRTFQSAKVLRVDSDKLKGKDQYINYWKEFSSGNADILIGTQIVAKGLDLPNVTLVGVVMADTMFNFPDYISHERAFQLLTQVSGRAGRSEKLGRVFIQTYQADNPVFRFIEKHNYKDFYENEIKERESLSYPPFTNLIRIIFQSQDEKECLSYADEVLKELNSIQSSSSQSSSFLGPAPCFFSKIQNKYRHHILCKIKDQEAKDYIFNNLFNKIKKNAKVDIILDVDSVNLL